MQQKLTHVEMVVPELDKVLLIAKKRSDYIHISQTNMENFMKVLEVLSSDSDCIKQLQVGMKSFCSEDGYFIEITSKVRTVLMVKFSTNLFWSFVVKNFTNLVPLLITPSPAVSKYSSL